MKSTFGTTALFSFLFLFLTINPPHNLISTAQLLPYSEVQALLIISLRLGIKQWNGVTSSSCSSGTGLNEISKENTVGNVTCNCGFENNTVCHVTNIQLKNLNLIGELPNEFAELTYLTEINLIRNNLNGTIPRSWASLPLVILSLLGNYISGTISSDIGKIATLEELVLEDNFMEGTLPPELGNLRRLRRAIFSGNNFNGTLPPTFANLTSLEDFRISGTSISGRIPTFIGNWTNLTKLHMQGTSMEGPIPSTISLLGKLTDLIISDLNVVNMPFPDLRDLTNLKELVLRNCSIIGELPSYIGASFPNMTNLDLSFNRLSGTIAQSQVQLMLEGKLKFVYLTNNLLTGNTSWLSSTTQKNRFIDISYNNFSGLVEPNCRNQSVNTMSSISTVAGNSIAWCLKKDLPCSKKADFYKLFINCGGNSMQFGNKQYEQDVEPMGASSFYSKKDESWASSTMGDFVGEEGSNYSASSDAVGSFREDIYSSARLAPQSLKYYGLCLRKGRYSVTLHFAEIMFTSYASTTKGTRIFC